MIRALYLFLTLNKTRMNLKEKIQSMTAKEIILAMVEGLKNPKTKIDMSTFGRRKGPICYGCAATNTIIKIGNLNPMLFLYEQDEDGCSDRAYEREEKDFMFAFECAIDALRGGNISYYNNKAWDKSFAQITMFIDIWLPCLEDDYTLEDLEKYEALAMAQE